MEEFLKQVELTISIFKTKKVETKEKGEDLSYLYEKLIKMADENSVVIAVATERQALKFFPDARIDFVELKAPGTIPIKPYTFHLCDQSEKDQCEVARKYRTEVLTKILHTALKGQAGIKIEKPD